YGETRLGQGKEKAGEYLAEHPDLLTTLREDVHAHLRGTPRGDAHPDTQPETQPPGGEDGANAPAADDEEGLAA
ncbi:MAG: hypothetical protein GVY27_06180, partial [Deinococcus-Thermus bacterium]|nr:hypothetical protein [Deinococcota bacterium]